MTLADTAHASQSSCFFHAGSLSYQTGTGALSYLSSPSLLVGNVTQDSAAAIPAQYIPFRTRRVCKADLRVIFDQTYHGRIQVWMLTPKLDSTCISLTLRLFKR
jgi:hypothetical protein